MRQKPYYAVRTGKHPTGGKLNLSDLKALVVSAYRSLRFNGYFQQILGIDPVDGDTPGTALGVSEGWDPGNERLELRLRDSGTPSCITQSYDLRPGRLDP